MSKNNNKNERVFQELKTIYETAEIPPELSKMVQDAIEKAKSNKPGGDYMKEAVKKKRIKSVVRSLMVVAAAVIVFIGGFGISVHTNQAFAQSVKDVPILGDLARVFTVHNIQEEDEIAKVDALIPEVQGLKDKELQVKINKEVNDKIETAISETKKVMAEAKEAWLATGGTEEDYTPMDIIVTYDVKCISDSTLSFVVYKTQTLASAYYEETYYNYDLKTSKELTLINLLGADYMEIANEQISAGITERSKAEGATFFNGENGIEGFSGIIENQNFYVNKAGNPVIVFNKYEIAPGYMGIQEFEIIK